MYFKFGSSLGMSDDALIFPNVLSPVLESHRDVFQPRPRLKVRVSVCPRPGL